MVMTMNCRDVERGIADFLKDNLSKKDKAAFIEHIKGCKNCKEELSIQFLVEEGIHKLENGESFDLNEELNKKLGEIASDNKKSFELHKSFIFVLLELSVIIAIILLILFIWFI